MLRRSKSLVICGLAAIFMLFLGSYNNTILNINDNENSPVALVKKIVKDVTYRTAVNKEDWELAKIGQPLFDGGEVKTGVKSLALILFTDGSGLLRVRESSILHIYGKTEDKLLRKNTFLEKGLIGFDVTKQKDDEFKFTTPTIVASIRGTAGFISYDNEDSTTIIYLDHGMVNFQHILSGKSGTISSGVSAKIFSDGNITYDSTSTQLKNTYKFTESINSKKVIIKSKYGTFEINYYSN
ncbi:FecR domain-containing protein [Melioribacteraceae bacterium 4301-Me]|uniref:FecR family protein n=1 Tax=Pyranulibacter aquaticus TaxID=3163344 RepID=UPI003595CE91